MRGYLHFVAADLQSALIFFHEHNENIPPALYLQFQEAIKAQFSDAKGPGRVEIIVDLTMDGKPRSFSIQFWRCDMAIAAPA